MTLVSAVSRRVMIHAHVSRTVDELAAVRWANGTTPPDPAAWVALIQGRALDLGADMDGLDDELLGLAADVLGLLESIVAEGAA